MIVFYDCGTAQVKKLFLFYWSLCFVSGIRKRFLCFALWNFAGVFAVCCRWIVLALMCQGLVLSVWFWLGLMGYFAWWPMGSAASVSAAVGLRSLYFQLLMVSGCCCLAIEAGLVPTAFCIRWCACCCLLYQMMLTVFADCCRCMMLCCGWSGGCPTAAVVGLVVLPPTAG